MFMFQYAIVCPPSENFALGLTTVHLGAPEYHTALIQHEHYCRALKKCGLEVIRLAHDARFPDSTFVEDVAVLTEHAAILTHPGAESRKGEVESIKAALAVYFQKVFTITPPGELDGGDICEAGQHFFIGISERTNEEGGRQLARFLDKEGYTSSFVPVTGVPGILHLKSGIAYLGDNRMILINAFVGREQFKGYEVIRVDESENYAANCVRVNDYILLAAGYPCLSKSLAAKDYQVISLDMSEFQKMDGGLSCLSLRF
jgi:dimethylargininase